MKNLNTTNLLYFLRVYKDLVIPVVVIVNEHTIMQEKKLSLSNNKVLYITSYIYQLINQLIIRTQPSLEKWKILQHVPV